MSTRRAFLGYLGAFSVVAITNPLKAIAIEDATVAAPLPVTTGGTGFDYAAELGRLSDRLPDMLGWSQWAPDVQAAHRLEALGCGQELIPGMVITGELPGIEDRVFEFEVLEVRGRDVHHRTREVLR